MISNEPVHIVQGAKNKNPQFNCTVASISLYKKIICKETWTNGLNYTKKLRLRLSYYAYSLGKSVLYLTITVNPFHSAGPFLPPKY